MSDTPKHTIRDLEAFQKGREKLGGLIMKGMKITGGTDVDWLVEHRGGFIILEFKSFHDNRIIIPLGQMIAFENLHKRLNNGGKCYFLIFAGDDGIDFEKNTETPIWYFEMKDWNDDKISYTELQNPRRYVIQRGKMSVMQVKDFRDLIESFWKEFE